MIRRDGSRNVDAVEDIPHVVQHARRHLRHARRAGRVDQFLMQVREFLLRALLLRDVYRETAHSHGSVRGVPDHGNGCFAPDHPVVLGHPAEDALATPVVAR